jgi:glutaredoxin
MFRSRSRAAPDSLLAAVPAEDAHGLPVRTVVLGRNGCHLCEDALAQVRQVAGSTHTGWAEVLLEDHPEVHERYAEQLPVVFVDGREHAYWRVDPRALTAALRRRPRRR